MSSFRFFYGLNLSFKIYSITDNLSKTLQAESMSVVESQETAALIIKTLKRMRNQADADAFYESTKMKAERFDFVEHPTLPRKRKTPYYKTLWMACPKELKLIILQIQRNIIVKCILKFWIPSLLSSRIDLTRKAFGVICRWNHSLRWSLRQKRNWIFEWELWWRDNNRSIRVWIGNLESNLQWLKNALFQRYLFNARIVIRKQEEANTKLD